ncbi:MAG: hypothetical protein ABEJ60_05175 [Halodesulfurarchaeum sp.]
MGVAVLLVVSGSVAAAQQPTTTSQTTITTHVHENGDATITIRLQYNLTSPTQREAFTAVSTDETLVRALETRFTTRMNAVASAITNATERTVTVTNTSVSFTRSGTTGEVVLAAEISNLAKQTGENTLVVTRPFSSGFTFDGPVKLVAPDGYVIESATPPADRAPSEGTRVWNAHTELDAFSVTMTQTAGTASPTPTQTPGMGVLMGILGISIGLGLVAAIVNQRGNPGL